MTAAIENVGDAHIQLWREQFTWSLIRAEQLRTEGDEFGAALVLTRGEVRAAAADVLAAGDTAQMLLDRAAGLCQSDISLADPDTSAMRYVRARTWQDCARQLDPALPEVQPAWR